MAKVGGPLFSMEAAGKFGGALVFAKRMGKNVVRQLTTPANPNAAGQETARNRVRAFGAIQRFFNATALVADGQTLTDKARIAAITPSGQRWNSYLLDIGIGAGGLSYTAALAAWAALDGTAQTAWDTAAAALTPVILEVNQTTTGGGSTTALSAGNVWFIAQYTLSLMGLASTPGATPPTYA